MGTETYLRNVWYAAALASEVTDNLLRRMILGEPVVLFREEAAGTPAALLDICPHRFAPLSMGKRVAGGLQCSYHGMAFAPSGKCILNPQGNGNIPPAAKVRSFPVVERYGLIWLWPGDLAMANASLIPDLGRLERADQRTRRGGHMTTNANYQMLTDNILDLSHADFLHPLLDSGGGTRHQAPTVEALADDSIMVSWTWSGPTLGFLAPLFERDAELHSRIEVRWYAPGVMHQRISCGLKLDELEDAVRTEAMHIMTPETAHQTHYFWGGVRYFDVGNDALTDAFNEAVRKAFSLEDKPMIEAAQMNMGAETDIFALRPLGLRGDAGGVGVRKMMRRLIAAQQHATSTAGHSEAT